MAAAADLYRGLLTVLTLTFVSSETKIVPRGSNITDCSLRCPRPNDYLSLYKESGHNLTHLLDLMCNGMRYWNYYESRLHLDNETGCWTVTGAGKDDSGVYKVVNHVSGVNITLIITVPDPGSSQSTSPSGESSSLDPRFFWLLSLLIVPVGISIWLVKCRNCRKTKSEDVEMNNTEDGGPMTSSSSETDPPGDQEEKTQEKNPLSRSLRTGKTPYIKKFLTDEEVDTLGGIQVTPNKQRRL